jgi:superfamily II DNA or RNA helicase
MTLHVSRPYQKDLTSRIKAAWSAGTKHVMAVLPTGGGKTHVVASVVEQMGLPAACIAHRSELVGQMSLALAREGVSHRVIGSDALRRNIVALHMSELGRSYYQPRSNYGVCSVDTLRSMSANDPWLAQVGLVVIDEGHHVLRENKWGKAFALFPNALALLPTATPTRADGKGLGAHADGIADVMLEGPSMRELIDAGYLTDYRVFAPPSNLDLASVGTTASGDFSPVELKAARHASTVTGDVVAHYLRVAKGKLGVTFDTDIESATETAAAFRAAGVPAEVVTGKTPDALRQQILRRFKAREILQLVNVDLFGEGFDLPAIEVVSMARPTQSFSLFVQQWGRSLRLMVDPALMQKWDSFTPAERKAHIAASGKPYAIVLDHVGNTVRHGLPDRLRDWSLDGRERRSKSTPDDTIPLRVCTNERCLAPYERVLPACPHCGTVPEIADRGKPEFVDGDLHELDAAVLAKLRGEIARIDAPPQFPTSAGPAVRGAIGRNHSERQIAQQELRQQIALWAGWQSHLGRGTAEAYRRFWHQFRVDVATAQTLGASDAAALSAHIKGVLSAHNVVEIEE